MTRNFLRWMAPLALVAAAGCDGRGADDGNAAAAANDPPVATRLAAQHLPDSEAGQNVLGYFEATNTPGVVAERRARDLLDTMRAQPQTVLAALHSAYTQTAESHYGQRWRVVSLAASLGSPSARQVLAEVAASPIPPERIQRVAGQHWDGGSQEEERLIRMEAVEGLGRLARAGDVGSEETLARLAASSDLVLRATAVHQLVKAGGYAQARRDAVAALLPEQDRWMVNQREVNLADLPLASNPGPGTKNKMLPALRPAAE